MDVKNLVRLCPNSQVLEEINENNKMSAQEW